MQIFILNKYFYLKEKKELLRKITFLSKSYIFFSQKDNYFSNSFATFEQTQIFLWNFALKLENYSVCGNILTKIPVKNNIDFKNKITPARNCLSKQQLQFLIQRFLHSLKLKRISFKHHDSLWGTFACRNTVGGVTTVLHFSHYCNLFKHITQQSSLSCFHAYIEVLYG